MAGDKDVLDRYLAHSAHLGHSPNTIRARRWTLLYCRRSAGDLLTATEQDLYRFVSRPKLSAETRANLVSAVKSFYRWAQRYGWRDDDPSIGLDRPRRPRRLPRPMPEADLARALELADEPIRAWLFLAAYAGLRCAEIAGLRGEDRIGDVLRITHQKGGDEGSVPVGPVLDEALAHLPRAGWWFPRWDGQPGPISPGQLQRHANRFLHSIGIDHTMHTARHRYGTRVYAISGRDLRVTQELMRHKSVLSTQGYTWIDPDDGRNVVARLA